MDRTTRNALNKAILDCLGTGPKSLKELCGEEHGVRALADPLRKKNVWRGGFDSPSGLVRRRLQELRKSGAIWFDGVGWQIVDAHAQAYKLAAVSPISADHCRT
jgi:hypothetical protein